MRLTSSHDSCGKLVAIGKKRERTATEVVAVGTAYQRWGTSMQHDERNAQGCPLRNQTGAASIKDFAAIIARLSPDLRRAFEDERKRQHDEVVAYVARYGYRT